MTRRHVIGSGVLVAAISAATVIVPAYLDYRLEMAAMQKSADEAERRSMCKRDGGKWYRGDCLEVYGPEEEP